MSKWINLDDPEVSYSHNNGQSEVYIVRPEAERLDLVTCGECKYRYVDGDNICELRHNMGQSDNWFCADGRAEQFFKKD